MPGAAAPCEARSVPAPAGTTPAPGPLMANKSVSVPVASPPAPAPRPVTRGSRSQARPGILPVMFAFAGHDLTREESRRWTLAAAFESRGY